MDALYDSIAIPILAAIAGAVVAVSLGLLVRSGEPRSLLTPAIGGAVLCVTLWLGYTALNYISDAQHQAERRALDDRYAALSRQASAPGSALGCLNGLSGEAVENACASALFATPESVAAAVAHVAARLTLLADSLAYAKRFDPKYDATVADLRRAAENDVFGLYAHVLAVRDGCTPDRCDVFALLRETGTLRAHLRQQIYEHRVAENSLRWLRQVAIMPPALPAVAPQSGLPAAEGGAQATSQATPPPRGMPSAQVTPPSTAVPAPGPAATASAQVPVLAPHGIVPPIASVLPNIEYPSSASIPPISIMTPEPRASTGAAAATPQADQDTTAGKTEPKTEPKTAAKSAAKTAARPAPKTAAKPAPEAIPLPRSAPRSEQE